MAAVWPGIAVTDDSLVQCIGEVRRAIGDEAHAVVRTVPRRGYRLALPAESAPVQADRPRRSGPLTLAAAVLAACVAGAAGWLAFRPEPNAAAIDGPPILAVVPFVDLAGDAASRSLLDAFGKRFYMQDLARFREFQMVVRGPTFVHRDQLGRRARGRLRARRLGASRWRSPVPDGGRSPTPGPVRLSGRNAGIVRARGVGDARGGHRADRQPGRWRDRRGAGARAGRRRAPPPCRPDRLGALPARQRAACARHPRWRGRGGRAARPRCRARSRFRARGRTARPGALLAGRVRHRSRGEPGGRSRSGEAGGLPRPGGRLGLRGARYRLPARRATLSAPGRSSRPPWSSRPT